MEPSPKRERLSGEIAEDGPTPLSLFDLSLEAMIKNAQNKVYPIKVDQLPLDITKQLWQKSSLFDIICNICHTETFELYSSRVIRPRKFIVSNYKRRHENHELCQNCDLYIKFDDGRTLKWMLKHISSESVWTYPLAPQLVFPMVGKWLKAKLVDRNEKCLTLHTDLTNAWNSRFGFIECFTKAFRCEIDEIKFRNDLIYHFDDLNNWDQLESVRSLNIKQCDNSEWLQTILPVRKNKNLKTSIDILNCLQPLPLCLLQSIEVSYIKSNVSALNQNDFIEYASAALKCTKEMVEFKISDFTTDQVTIFQTRLNLSDDIKSLNEHYEHHCSREKELKPTTTLYSINDNDTAFVYYFLEKTPGVFNELLGFVRKAKPQPVQ